LNKNILYLLTILEAIEKIRIYTASFHDAQTLFTANDQKDFNAVLNLLIAIGEESKKLSADIQHQASTTDWQAIAGLRNELSHNYRGVDPDIVWNIVTEYLEQLKQTCVHLLKTSSFDKTIISTMLDTIHYRHLSYLRTALS
jgi:uncharacterized protein with HEPN domain